MIDCGIGGIGIGWTGVSCAAVDTGGGGDAAGLAASVVTAGYGRRTRRNFVPNAQRMYGASKKVMAIRTNAIWW